MKLQTKPENDPWTVAAMKTRGYRVYLYQHRCAASMSWRRLKKIDDNVRTARTKNARRIFNAIDNARALGAH